MQLIQAVNEDHVSKHGIRMEILGLLNWLKGFQCSTSSGYSWTFANHDLSNLSNPCCRASEQHESAALFSNHSAAGHFL